jgi:hypothetical protein
MELNIFQVLFIIGLFSAVVTFDTNSNEQTLKEVPLDKDDLIKRNAYLNLGKLVFLIL